MARAITKQEAWDDPDLDCMIIQFLYDFPDYSVVEWPQCVLIPYVETDDFADHNEPRRWTHD